VTVQFKSYIGEQNIAALRKSGHSPLKLAALAGRFLVILSGGHAISAPVDPLLRDIARTKRKIEIKIKHFERGVTNPRPVTVKKYQQSLRNLREHLALLESRLSKHPNQETIRS
jgi:hypothetical protein